MEKVSRLTFSCANMKHHRETPPPCGEYEEVQGHPDDATDCCHDNMMMLLPLILLAKKPRWHLVEKTTLNSEWLVLLPLLLFLLWK